MKYNDIKSAISEAKTFIERAESLIEERNESGRVHGYVSGTKKSGAVRRQSMELTNALVLMRRS